MVAHVPHTHIHYGKDTSLSLALALPFPWYPRMKEKTWNWGKVC